MITLELDKYHVPRNLRVWNCDSLMAAHKRRHHPEPTPVFSTVTSREFCNIYAHASPLQEGHYILWVTEYRVLHRPVGALVRKYHIVRSTLRELSVYPARHFSPKIRWINQALGPNLNISYAGDLSIKYVRYESGLSVDDFLVHCILPLTKGRDETGPNQVWWLQQKVREMW